MGKRKPYQTALFENVVEYEVYIERLANLAISRFKWNGLPEGCDERYLERTLVFNGNAIFFEDDTLKQYLTLKMLPTNKFTPYGLPSVRSARGSNDYRYDNLTDENSVIIYDNLLHVNIIPMLRHFAMRLWSIDRIIDININAQKTPLLLIGEKSEELSLRTLYQKYDGNEPVIFGNKGLSTNTIQAINTQAPLVAPNLNTLKLDLWGEALTYMGISNDSVNKKERLITQEVEKSQGSVIINRISALKSRQLAAEKMSKLCGQTITVEYSETSYETELSKIAQENSYNDGTNTEMGGGVNE